MQVMMKNGKPVDVRPKKEGLQEFLSWLQEMDCPDWSLKPLTMVALSNNLLTLLNQLSAAGMLEEFRSLVPYHIAFKSVLGKKSFFQF